MSLENKLFFELTKTEMSDISKVKSELSAKYLRGQMSVKGMATAFRAAPSSAAVHNVVGVGIDEKYVDGIPTGTVALKFLVRSKAAASTLTDAEKIPAFIDGIPTDVEEVGLIIPQAAKKAATKKAAAKKATTMPNPQTKHRPAKPGSSIGFREPNDLFIMAGTFGLLVKDSKNDQFILSNNHVIAFENGVESDGTTRRDALAAGAPIFQPGFLDGGKPADKIAELTRWIDLRADRDDNLVDGAIARVNDKKSVAKEILFIGAPTGTKSAAKDMIVHKFGRTTSYRAGRVSSVVFDVTVPYEVGDVVFIDQIAVRGLNGQRFSDSGDSGSAILERETNKVVGLLFAGATNGSLTFANHISDVLSQLKVKLV